MIAYLRFQEIITKDTYPFIVIHPLGILGFDFLEDFDELMYEKYKDEIL